ncbi:MAG: hypothetical protein PHV32_11085 [Eubacteriales bacterium]|nr:hypothetical protein [Eubacteriales bacterium]
MTGKCKLLYITVFALVAVVLLQIFALTPQVFAQERISIDVEAGYNGVAKIGSQVNFRIGLQNNGEEISGEVQVVIPAPDQTEKIYAIPTELPANSSKMIVLSAPYNYSFD